MSGNQPAAATRFLAVRLPGWIATEITSVTRLSNSCRYSIVLNGTQGSTGFTVPYTSTGGHAISRAVQITVGAASSIVFSAPLSNPAVAASRTLTLDVGSYATDGSYTITCGTITEFSALISLGAQTQGSCSIPCDRLHWHGHRYYFCALYLQRRGDLDPLA